MEDHLEKRNPLWAKWVNKVKLKGKSIWDVDYNSSDRWGWKNMINNNDCLADVIHDGRWRWPNEWNNMFPKLRQINVPIMSNRYNYVKWVDVHNHIKCNPTQAFILWMAIQGKLLTQDRMVWVQGNDLKCSLCNSGIDSHKHLSFECQYSRKVWNGMSSKGRLIGRGYWLDNVIRTIEVSHIEGLYITYYNEINLLWFSYEKRGLLLVNEGSSTVLHIRGDPKDVEKERTLAKTYNSIATTRGKPSRSESGIKEDGKKQSSRIFQSAKMSDEWRLGEVIPIYKNKEKVEKGDGVSENQFGFMSGRSPIEAIILLRSLMEKYRERQRGLYMAFLHLEKAYDSVSPEGLNNKPEHLREALEENGLRVIREKTEYLRCDFGMDVTAHNEEVDISIGDQILQLKESFRYLGSVIHKSRRIDNHVTHRIRVGWVRWRAASEVLCDKKVPFKLKGKCYRVAIRSAILYGSECWPVIRAQANKVEVAELM
ncbi:retrovirus-related pol polyprotein LINE-1 [Tanacetum coccineum]